jgi:porin
LPAFLAAANMCSSHGALAAEETNNDEAGISTANYSLPEYLRKLTDWNAQRSALEQKGVTLAFTYYGDAFANPKGGLGQGAGYDGRFGAIIDADLEKLAAWSGGAFHASIHQIHGSQFSASNLNNLMTVSGIEGPPSTRLFNLWIEQNLGASTNLRMGQFTAAQEFEVSQNANLFVNSSFGWPLINAADLPSGGPAYPEATPGVRLRYKVNDQLIVSAAVFNGDPAGPGPGNSVERDPHGFAFRVTDPPFFIAEVAYSYGQTADARGNPNQEGDGRASRLRLTEGALPGTLKLGAWYHSGGFADVGPALTQHGGDSSFYGILDQMLWRVPGSSDRGLNVFVRGSLAPSDRNVVDTYVDGGLIFKGPFATRPDDALGLGVAFGRISPRASEADRETTALSGTPMPIRDFEAAVELTYQWKLADNWLVQPDLQYVIHPGANVASPANPIAAIPNALVLGTRATLRF